jgi:AraC-like DNA-binding protein
MQSTLYEYYASIPVLKNTSSLFIMLETFCERVFERSSFAVVDLTSEKRTPASLLNVSPSDSGFDDHLAKMKVLEKRYEFENTMIRSVMLGRQLTDRALLPDFATLHFESRSSSPIRSAKNYCIILNTLLRKSAEAGGVHPVYLDRISSDFAKKIEDLSVLSVCPMLMNEMLSAYCKLVQKHSIKKYSHPVQKAIMLIDYDLSAPLTLSTIATAQGLSEGYLAKVFKKETGKTVCEYVRDKRMKHAEHLLSTTRLQIQTIALHCGFVDLQYFSRLFKRHVGKTPKEYRQARR